jgi:phospholipid/cholesterol/gamma-HCH transport system substrate-binding protein
VIARVSAVVALGCAVVVVALVVLTSGSQYTLRANFQDVGGLVPGDDVLIGPARVGTIQSVSLTSNGQAQVKLTLNSGVGPIHQGTVARIYENSLSGLANRYVVLQPAPTTAPSIPSGGTIGEDHTYSFVSLDQLFDTLDPLTRSGLSNFIRGQAAAIAGKASQYSRTLQYLAPGLSSTSQVTAELTRDEPAFDGLLVQGAQALQTLASRSTELTDLVANTNATTSAIASQSQALQRALALFPGTLTHSTRTFQGLQSTLDALDPVVAESKLADRRLEPFAASLRQFTNVAIPTVADLNGLIHNPNGTGDLTKLAQLTPSLARLGAVTFPDLIRQMNDSENQIEYLREFAPDVVSALGVVGQAAGYYDANGHYVRVVPTFFGYGVGGLGQLTSKPPNLRYQGLQVVHTRCPGSAVQPPPDGSAPVSVPGCQTSSTPPGP